MKTSITRHFSDALPEPGTPFMVVPAEDGRPRADLYRNHVNVPLRCAAGLPILALIRTPLLSTPDLVAVLSVCLSGSELTVEVEIRKFTGDLAANDPWIALIGVELGKLEAGKYGAAVITTILQFDDQRDPESAADPVVTEQLFHFECD